MPPDPEHNTERPVAVDPILILPEAADVAKVSVRHLQSLIASGRLPVVRLGRRVLIRRETLLAFLASIERPEGGAK